MKRPHILDMDAPVWTAICGVEADPWRGDPKLAAVSPREHERHPERTCEACRAAYEGRK